MSKSAALGSNLYVGQFDLSGDIASLGSISSSRAVLDDTAIDVSAMERLHGLRDGAMEVTSYFNPASNRAHPVLRALPSTDRIASFFKGPIALGSKVASINSKQLNYDGNRQQDGSLIFTSQFLGNKFGLEWGHNLTAGKHTQAGAGNLTGFNDGAGAATDFGLQAYLHVFAFTGDDCTIVLQDSNDNGGADAYAAITGAGFTQFTAVTSERIQTARNENVKEWIRVAVSGTFTSVQFAVAVRRNIVNTVF